MSVVSLYVIFANLEEAERIGRTVVEEKLAACINILAGVRSIYRWKGAVTASEEVAAILKTSSGSIDALMVRIASLHSYDVPCILSSPVDKVLSSYAEWVEEAVR